MSCVGKYYFQNYCNLGLVVCADLNVAVHSVSVHVEMHALLCGVPLGHITCWPRLVTPMTSRSLCIDSATDLPSQICNNFPEWVLGYASVTFALITRNISLRCPTVLKIDGFGGWLVGCWWMMCKSSVKHQRPERAPWTHWKKIT